MIAYFILGLPAGAVLGFVWPVLGLLGIWLGMTLAVYLHAASCVPAIPFTPPRGLVRAPWLALLLCDHVQVLLCTYRRVVHIATSRALLHRYVLISFSSCSCADVFAIRWDVAVREARERLETEQSPAKVVAAAAATVEPLPAPPPLLDTAAVSIQ